MTTKSCVVVGGGIVGLLASYLATKNFENVFLVERSNEIGGLLSSFERNGVIYDYETHIPALTGIDDLDEILYGLQSERDEKLHIPAQPEHSFRFNVNTNSGLS
jgi:protoporphyrinogen oxidase